MLPHLPAWLTQTLETLDRANLPLLASALTFDALLAVIPLAILVIAGLGQLLAHNSYFDAASPGGLIISFLPQHAHGPTEQDPFKLVEDLLAQIRGYRSPFTVIAVPAFIWLSTRLFASMRACLTRIFHVRQKTVRGHWALSYIAGYLLAKGQDLAMVGVLLTLAMFNTLAAATLGVITAKGVTLRPPWTLLVSTVGFLVGHAITIVVGVMLFALLYRYASPKRLRWSGALLAGGVAAFGFELSKQLFGLYLRLGGHSARYAISTNINAGLLLLAWLWYMAFVFLVGAAVADVWDRTTKEAGASDVR